MNDILNKIKKEDVKPSSWLDSAIAVANSDTAPAKKLADIEALAKRAPEEEQEAFGDVMSSVLAQQERDD